MAKLLDKPFTPYLERNENKDTKLEVKNMGNY